MRLSNEHMAAAIYPPIATDTLSAQQKADILGNTAARVLKITG